VSADSPADRPDLDPPGGKLERPDAADRAADLGGRLDRLPPGHPSSPYGSDGTPREPLPRLRALSADADAPPADHDSADESGVLTDSEWHEHVADVRDLLGEADAAGLETDVQYTTDPDREQWTPDRDRAQGELVASLYERASEVPCDRLAIMAGGLGGAGKSTVLSKHAGIDLGR